MSPSSSFEMAAGTPPQGQTTDFNQQTKLWPSLIAVSTISLVIMTSAVTLRIYSKLVKMKARLTWEDYFSMTAVFLMTIWTVLYSVAAHYGASKHQWNVRASSIPLIFDLLNICDIFYGPMLLLAKLSLLLQLRRYSVRTTSAKAMSWLIWPTGITIVGYYFSCIFQFAFQCVPRRGLWDSSVKATCGNAPALTFAAAAFGLLTDLLLYGLFVWIVSVKEVRDAGGWKVLTPIHVVALFGITTASATLYYRVPFVNADPKDFDMLYHVAIVGIWAMAEYAAIILVGCLPAIGFWLWGQKGHGEKEEDTESGSNV